MFLEVGFSNGVSYLTWRSRAGGTVLTLSDPILSGTLSLPQPHLWLLGSHVNLLTLYLRGSEGSVKAVPGLWVGVTDVWIY